LTKNSLPKRKSTPASSRNHLRPLREPRATTSQYKQATFCQKRETRRRSRQQGWGHSPFEINPKLEEDKHVYLAAVDDQAELMHWHYHLGHLPFSKLKQLALNSEIPQRLAKVKPFACVGCLFGAMTKVPWKG
jgi:hypothetical protein